MRLLPAVRALVVLIVVSASAISAQSLQSVSSQSVPRLINISGVFRPANGQPASAVETVTLSIYADSEGGAPLWQETQTIALDGQGRYALLLGATQADGIPAAVFGTGDAKWLGTVFERAGEVEGPRIRITSVPYALRASDADTLGGRPASAYLLAPGAGGIADANAAAVEAGGVTADVVLPGTPNFLAKYVNGADVGSSGVFEAADGAVGMGTTTPFDRLHVRYDNNTGDFTGLAVQNTNGGALAYSGMLFYDHTNALTQFQGYNNSTHEYRINNIARVSPGGAFNGSINFMLGGTSRFFANTSGVGIGTTTPLSSLEVSNALSPGGSTSTTLTTYLNAFGGSSIVGQRARGTAVAPTALQNGDGLLELNTRGYNGTGFAQGAAAIAMGTSENWTNTAQGTQISFWTTANGTATPGTRMRIAPSGNVGIGTFSPTSLLDVSNGLSTQPFAQATVTTFANSAAASLFVGSKARGTSAAPAAVQLNDTLAGFLGRGYGATNFSATRGGMFVSASENWTDTAQGTRLNFNTTVNGTNTPGTRMTIDNAGNVGIGTTAPSEAVEVVREGQQGAGLLATSYGAEQTNGGSAFVMRNARGTRAAPAAVQLGDSLGYFVGTGYGTSGFGDEFAAGMGTFAGENWTDTAQGAGLYFAATPIGSTGAQAYVGLLPSGNVGIGVFNDIPTITDKLQVFGDIRVGTSGTNGCLKNFNGDPLTGSCASDRRYKKDIMPFGPLLRPLAALQPVHYFWRAAEFPSQNFGEGRSYGLIAQDVEQVLPELVVTGADGFKTVDYSKLPLLTIQAVKELNAENDALKQRVSELERLVNELLAASSRR